MNISELLWLFTSNPDSRGIIRQNLGEAELLYRLAREAWVGVLEIGRLHGGSTVLIATAMGPSEVPFTSVDLVNQVKSPCAAVLASLAAGGRAVTLVTGNSRFVELQHQCDLVFIDGDHEYRGVKGDLENARKYMVPGAVVAFHDAIPTAYGGCAGVIQYTNELLESGELERVDAVDTLLVCRWKGLPTQASVE